MIVHYLFKLAPFFWILKKKMMEIKKVNMRESIKWNPIYSFTVSLMKKCLHFNFSASQYYISARIFLIHSFLVFQSFFSYYYVDIKTTLENTTHSVYLIVCMKICSKNWSTWRFFSLVVAAAAAASGIKAYTHTYERLLLQSFKSWLNMETPFLVARSQLIFHACAYVYVPSMYWILPHRCSYMNINAGWLHWDVSSHQACIYYD